MHQSLSMRAYFDGILRGTRRGKRNTHVIQAGDRERKFGGRIQIWRLKRSGDNSDDAEVVSCGKTSKFFRTNEDMMFGISLHLHEEIGGRSEVQCRGKT